MPCPFQKIWFNLALSSIGICLGCSGFVVFFALSNYEAGILGLASAGLALNTFLMHHAKHKGVLERYTPARFGRLEILGFIGLLSGVALMLWYIFMQIHYRTPILPVKTSIVIRLVWAFMTFKCGLLLYLHSKMYSKFLEDSRILVRNIMSDE